MNAIQPTVNAVLAQLLQHFIICLLLAATSIDAFRSYRAVDILNDLTLGDKLDIAGMNGPSTLLTSRDNDSNDYLYDTVQELNFTQRLDHFDPLNHVTYSQRYFYSDRFVSLNKNRSVTFLCVGGEGPGFTKSVLVDSDHCTGDMIELAKKLHLSEEYGHFNVHMYALEHRYYGTSYPVFSNASNNNDTASAVTTEHLKYLSSRQALEDLAHFVHIMQQQQQQDTDDVSPMPWITFGGSYPGYMAGNARLKYPHLISAAVSNSAPLDIKVEFPGYNQRVGWDLQYEKIGGSQQCHAIVKQGHDQAVALLDTDPVALAQLFHVCDPETVLLKRSNQNLLLGDGLISIYAQGNDPACQESDICNIKKLCDYMITSYEQNGTAPLQILANVADKQREQQRGRKSRRLQGVNEKENDDDDDDDCQSVDFDKLLQQMAEPVIKGFGWRSWLWQTCTEVGFYQTCDESCPFASHFHTVDQDLAICQAAYNITPPMVYENIQATIDHYGGLDISSGSRLLSVNGNVDPWSVLGLHSSPKYSLPVEMVPGASHHFWTHAVHPTDEPEIVQIREYIYSVVMEWLGIDSTQIKTGTQAASLHNTNQAPQLHLRGRDVIQVLE